LKSLMIFYRGVGALAENRIDADKTTGFGLRARAAG